MTTTGSTATKATPPERPGRARKGGLRHTWARMLRGDSELDAERLREASADHGATALDACRCHDVVEVAGRLRSVLFHPTEHEPTLEAELFDGSGAVTLVWLGRRRIPGIEPGRRIKVRGRLSSRQGKQVIFNPWYELLPVDR